MDEKLINFIRTGLGELFKLYPNLNPDTGVKELTNLQMSLDETLEEVEELKLDSNKNDKKIEELEDKISDAIRCLED